jgi:threonine/homoserine/homoserine lactone efflux protein
MPDSTNLLIFMTATLALNLTPGPDMLYVIARSTGEGIRAGVVSAFGIASGGLVHMSAVAFGLASLLQTVPMAYDVIRYAGAAYLIYLGTRIVLGRPSGADDARVERASLGRIYRQGVVTNVLNPKVALFFAAFLPQFADPARGSVLIQLVVLGLLFNVSGTIVNLLVALAAGRAGEKMRHRMAPTSPWRKMTGVVFVGLGLRLALERRG